MRDKLIHQYFGVDLQLVWIVATDILPPFRDKMAALLTDPNANL